MVKSGIYAKILANMYNFCRWTFVQPDDDLIEGRNSNQALLWKAFLVVKKGRSILLHAFVSLLLSQNARNSNERYLVTCTFRKIPESIPECSK